MRIYKVRLNTLDRVRDFVRIVSMQRDKFEFVEDEYTINAKSVLGIFSLNLMKPLMLRTEADSLPGELRVFLDKKQQ